MPNWVVSSWAWSSPPHSGQGTWSASFRHSLGSFYHSALLRSKQGWQREQSHKNLNFTRATATKLPYMETSQSVGGPPVPWWCCLDANCTEVAILSHAHNRVLKISPVLQCQLHGIGQISNSEFMPGFLCGMCLLSTSSLWNLNANIACSIRTLK